MHAASLVVGRIDKGKAGVEKVTRPHLDLRRVGVSIDHLNNLGVKGDSHVKAIEFLNVHDLHSHVHRLSHGYLRQGGRHAHHDRGGRLGLKEQARQAKGR